MGGKDRLTGRRVKPAKVKIEIQLAAARRELTEALEQQAATGEILRVISSSPTDVQPVFDMIATRAMTLCDAEISLVQRSDGEQLHLAAIHGADPVGVEVARNSFPMPLSTESCAGRAVRTRGVVHLADVLDDPTYALKEQARAMRFRSGLAVPMLRDEQVIGAVYVGRSKRGLFSDTQVELLKTFADQAVIAIENVRLFNETKEALEQQTATSEILRVIASSPTDVEPVFATIAERAVKLCDAELSVVSTIEGEHLHLAAMFGLTDERAEATRRAFPMPLDAESTSARAVRSRAVAHFVDAIADSHYEYKDTARVGQWRGTLAVPMFRRDQVIGAIFVARANPGPFSDKQIKLLQTFADQAVIAIENVRLFTELQQKNEALTQAHAQVSESLEQQTATSEILRVISRSPTDVQPVFDTIVANAVRLCGAQFGTLIRFDGHFLHLAAHHKLNPAALEFLTEAYPRALDTHPLFARAMRERRVVQVADVEAEPDLPSTSVTAGRMLGYRGQIVVPIIGEGVPVGTLSLGRVEPGPFSERQIELLKTFADQAVIAIENVRLFTELQASNRELTTALDTQTATSDILRVISRSQADVQPVFDAILGSVIRLLRGYSGAVTRIAGDQIELAALTSIDDARDAAVRATFPHSLQSEEPHAQALRDRAPLNIADAHSDPRLPEGARAYARARGFRSWVLVPLLRHEEAVGSIGVTRRDPGGFTDDEIALLKTFADQAVIAIENARLLRELQARTAELTRSVGELRALGEISQAISSTLDLQTVLSTIVARATQLAGVDAGVIYEYDEQREVFEPRATERLEADIVQMLVATPVRKGQGATGRLAEVLEPIQLADLRDIAEQIPVRDVLLRAGYRALLAVPLVRENHLIGGLTVFRKAPGEFASEVVELLQTFATQSALAIQNARLFLEIEDKSRQLEVASQHKSEFLANMSHELRTPLNAIIGFSEVLTERMFGELNEKQDEYLKDIYASGQHLLSLINDILDLSKIEAGRMELEPADFDLPGAIDNALTLVRERAGRRDHAWPGHRRASGHDTRRRAQGETGAAEPPLQRAQVHARGRSDRRPRRRERRHGGGVRRGHRRGHRPRGSGGGVRGVPAGGDGRQEGGGYRARAGPLSEVHRTAWRPDLGEESGRDGLDVHVHGPGAPRAKRPRRCRLSTLNS